MIRIKIIALVASITACGIALIIALQCTDNIRESLKDFKESMAITYRIHEVYLNGRIIDRVCRPITSLSVYGSHSYAQEGCYFKMTDETCVAEEEY